MVPTWLRRPLPRSSRPAPIGKPFSEKAVWVRPYTICKNSSRIAVLIASQTKSAVQRFQNGFANQDFARHGGAVRHPGATDGFNQRLLDDSLFDVQCQLTGALLRCAPADAVGQAADVLYFLGFVPICPLQEWEQGSCLGPLATQTICSTSCEYCME